MIEAYLQDPEQSESSYEHPLGFATDGLSFQDSLGILAQYSLVSAIEGKATFSIHPVVHSWTLHNITDKEVRRLLWGTATRIVAKSLPQATGFSTEMMAQRLLPHARMVATRLEKAIKMEGLECELHHIAYCMEKWECSREVEILYLGALEGYEEVWGPKHTLTLNAVNNLGAVYAAQGKMEAAGEMCSRALQGYEEVWGPKHALTINAVNNLGAVYAAQGKMKEAEEMYLRALEGKEEEVGLMHRSTLRTVNNLGVLYWNQGKIKEAEEMYVRALKGKEEALGLAHRSTLRTVNNLGVLYRNQGKMKKAEEMYVHALKGMEEACGSKHRSTFKIINNLGVLYKKQGKMKMAEEMYVHALKGMEEAFGLKHRSTLEIINNLGVLYYHDAWSIRVARRMSQRPSWQAPTRDGSKSIVSCLTKLLHLYSQYAGFRDHLYNRIGRVLIWVGDEANAKTAFQQGVNGAHGAYHYGNTICDGCDRALTLETNRFVCTSCEDIDLCNMCYNEYGVQRTTKAPMSDCTEHRFLEVPQPEVLPSAAVQDDERQSWVEMMLVRYPIETITNGTA